MTGRRTHRNGRKNLNKRYLASIKGHWFGWIEQYKMMLSDKETGFLSVTNINDFGGQDALECCFTSSFAGETLKEVQKMFWHRFHGKPHSQGHWHLDYGTITDRLTGNTWRVNDCGRVYKSEEEKEC